MTEESARILLLIKSMEQQDVGHDILSAADRADAARVAWEQTRSGSDTSADASGETSVRRDAAISAASAVKPVEELNEEYLRLRSEFLFQKLVRTNPDVRNLLSAMGKSTTAGAILCFLALVLGLSSNALGPEHRVSILAFPIFGALLWNLTVYAFLVGRAVVRSHPAQPTPGLITGPWVWLTSRLPRQVPTGSGQTASRRQRALEQFLREWIDLTRPLHVARAKLALHMAAMLVALGMLAGMYLRGLRFEYLAGWESTFLDPDAVHAILSLVLGPASWLTGIELPGPAHLAQLRWPLHMGENAARWIHLYAMTIVIFVVVPRAVLALEQGVRSRRWSRHVPIPLETDLYFRRLLRNPRHATAQTVQIVEYGFELPVKQKERLTAFIYEWLGLNANIRASTNVLFGAEDSWLEQALHHEPVDYLLLIFNLASTPEVENHGRLMTGLRDIASDGKIGTLVAIVEESTYRLRMEDGSGSSRRLDERRKLWQAIAHESRVKVLFVDIDRPEPERWLAELQPAVNPASDSSS